MAEFRPDVRPVVLALLIASLGPTGSGSLVARAQTSSPPGTLGALNVTPSAITVGQVTTITVTTRVLDASVIPTSVNLHRVDAAGRVLSTLGTLRDDGLGRDATARDRIFTGSFGLTVPVSGQVYLRVSAAFRSQLLRIFSEVAETIAAESPELCRAVTQEFEPQFCRKLTDLQLLSESDAIDAFGSRASAFAPVVLVHGLSNCGLGARDYWQGMPRLLTGVENGVDVWQVRYDSHASHQTGAEALNQLLPYVTTATGQTGVTLVAHSNGGLISRRYLSTNGGDSVFRLITIGTPHLGTDFLWPLNPCEGARDARPDRVSAFNNASTAPDLRAEANDYVFLGGRAFSEDRRNPVCLHLIDSDTVVDLSSQTADGLVFPNAVRETFDRYRHSDMSVYSACGEQPEIPGNDSTGAGHQIYQAVRFHVRVPASFRADIDYLSPPTIYDNARDGFGQTFVATGTSLRGISLYIRDPTRPDENVNELVGPADLVLSDISNPAHPIEIRRKQVLASGQSRPELLKTFLFDGPVPTIVGRKYFLSIATDDLFGLGLLQQFGSTYPGGAESYINCARNAPCDLNLGPAGAVLEEQGGRDASFKIIR